MIEHGHRRVARILQDRTGIAPQIGHADRGAGVDGVGGGHIDSVLYNVLYLVHFGACVFVLSIPFTCAAAGRWGHG